MQKTEQLVPGKYYHIYNCGINGENLFRTTEDYERFLRLYEKYINPVVDTIAWVLMKNHFHFLVRIKQNLAYKYSNDDRFFDKEKFNEIKWETIDVSVSIAGRSIQSLTGLADAVRFESNVNLSASDEGGPDSVKKISSQHNKKPIIPKAHLHFSHLFNSYAKYLNTKYKRHGTLFERQFQRKEIDNKRYFRSVIIYIHQNPVHHGFCEHSVEYGWSSYLTCISLKPTDLRREEVIGWFDNLGKFKTLHDKKVAVENIEKYLDL